MMGSLIPLALTIAPEIARWLFGDDAEKTTSLVSQAVEAGTGSSDLDAATSVLQKDPAAASQLRLQLARIAADCERVARSAELAQLATTLQGAAEGRSQSGGVSSQRAAIAWSAPIMSAVVLLTFGAVMSVVLRYGMPTGSETSVNMLLGTLAAMATSVVSYWVGSSAGSARKDDRLAQALEPDRKR